METCYKMFKTEKIQSLNRKENRFVIKHEVMTKFSKIKSVSFYEVGIIYCVRTFEGGKIISLKDGFIGVS
jgi:hypothetical protein